MITNPLVFDPEYLPHRLKGRGGEENQLLRAFEPAVDGEPADDTLIHGPKGVGKTVLARHAIARVQNQASIKHAHIGCLGKSTAGIIRAILRNLPGEDPYRTMPLEDLVVMLDERVTSPTIAVLDEADDLPTTNALKQLAGIRGLSVVVICHHEDEWLSQVDRDIQQRLACNVGLDRYGVDTLSAILDDRVNMGMEPGVITQSQLCDLADGCAGIARQAIYALEAAANIAEERGHSEITDEDVADSFARAEARARDEHLASLPLHHHVVYELVRRRGPLDASAVHEEYEAVADDVYHDREQHPVGERERRNKLQKLRSYDLIRYTGGENRHGQYVACDETLESPLDIPLPA